MSKSSSLNFNANFDYEIFEMFKDQCYSQLPSMEKKIIGLTDQDDYSENINDLFRMFHNYKSTSKYLGLDNIHSLVKKTEDVLGGLRNLQALNDEGIIEWLLQIKDQFEVWMDEMDLGRHSFSSFDPSLLTAISVTPDIPNPSEVIKTLKMLYIDKNEGRAKIISAALMKILLKVESSNSLKVVEKCTKDNIPDIILINMDDENKKYFDVLVKNFPKAAFIVAYDKVNRSLLLELGKHGINNILTNPIKGPALKHELLNVAHAYFSQRRVLINNKKIYKFIQTLEPLPNTIMQIQQVCDDDELSVKDLVEVVKRDPIIVGIILNAASSPIYGLKTQNNSIENIIAVFGKKTVKAISLGLMSSYLGEMKLKPYGINEEQFIKTGSLRLVLMNSWYKHVNKDQLATLSTTAILGNLGQLLISQEIEKTGELESFQEIALIKGYQAAEEELLHTNSSYVTSDILSFWRLKPKIIDSIRYSADTGNAPLEIRELAIANFIVYTLVDLDAKVKEEIPNDILFLMSEEGLNPKHLQEALDSIKNF